MLKRASLPSTSLSHRTQAEVFGEHPRYKQHHELFAEKKTPPHI